MYLFKLKKGIAFLYDVDKIIYKEVRHYVVNEIYIDNEKVRKSILKSGKINLDSGYFIKSCEYISLDRIIEETLKFKKQYKMISAVFNNDGTY